MKHYVSRHFDEISLQNCKEEFARENPSEISICEEVSLFMKVKRKYMLGAPKGVDARSSDNTQIKNILKWEPNFELHEGLKNTFEWIYKEYKKTN